MNQLPNANRGELRRYLIGVASDEEREEVEKALLDEDPSVFEELLAVEDELIDEVAAGELSPEEAASFLTYVDVLPERRSEVWVASQLAQSPPSAAPVRTVVSPRRFSVVSALMSVAAGILAMVVGWNAVSRAPAPGSTETTPGLEATAPTKVIYLTSSRFRSGGALPTVRAGSARRLQLRLDLAQDDGARYRAELRDADARSIIIRDDLSAVESPDEIVVALELDPFRLESGDYYIELSGSGAHGPFELVGRYDFRVAPR